MQRNAGAPPAFRVKFQTNCAPTPFALDNETIHLAIDMQRLLAEPTECVMPWLPRVLPEREETQVHIVLTAARDSDRLAEAVGASPKLFVVATQVSSLESSGLGSSEPA